VVAFRSDAQGAFGSLKVRLDSRHEFVDLMKNPNYMVNAGVRSIDKNAIRQSQLPKTIESLHRGSMQNLQLGA
jgi:hypothetical protein